MEIDEGKWDYHVRPRPSVRGQLEPDQPLEARRGHEIIHLESAMLHPEVRALRHPNLHPRRVFRSRPEKSEKEMSLKREIIPAIFFKNMYKMQYLWEFGMDRNGRKNILVSVSDHLDFCTYELPV